MLVQLDELLRSDRTCLERGKPVLHARVVIGQLGLDVSISVCGRAEQIHQHVEGAAADAQWPGHGIVRDRIRESGSAIARERRNLSARKGVDPCLAVGGIFPFDGRLLVERQG